jgi:hypothetical protein
VARKHIKKTVQSGVIVVRTYLRVFDVRQVFQEGLRALSVSPKVRPKGALQVHQLGLVAKCRIPITVRQGLGRKPIKSEDATLHTHRVSFLLDCLQEVKSPDAHSV